MQDQSAAAAAKSIYMVTAKLNRIVHEQAHGFTKEVFRFAYASSPIEAASAVEIYLKSQGWDVHSSKAGDNETVNQDANAYTFPHQIINLPKSTLDACYESRGYPPTWRDPARVAKIPPMQ